MYKSVFKRLIDILISFFALFLLSPLLLIAILSIKVSSSGPIFFSQERAGKGGRAFTVMKLRTMTVNPKRKMTQTTVSDPEVIPVGKALRRLKLDELPQLLNVLKGDMSLVGPRPCLVQTRDEMPGWAKKRFDVSPGLTGLAQVNGNIALTWEERWKYDILYVDNLTFVTDFKIILKTFLVVLLGEERFKK